MSTTNIVIHSQHPHLIEVPRYSALASYAMNKAVRSGRVYLDCDTGMLMLCDDANLVLWNEMLCVQGHLNPA